MRVMGVSDLTFTNAPSIIWYHLQFLMEKTALYPGENVSMQMVIGNTVALLYTIQL